MAEHSRLAPSAAARWVVCPGSVTLSEQFPELLENPAAAEGSAAHWVVDQLMQGSPPALGAISPQGVAVTDEMIEGAILYASHVMPIAGQNLDGRFRWEHREHMPSIHPEMFGTPDGAGLLDLCELSGDMHVFDYKFGHSEVAAEENWQLIAYARGVLDRLGFDGLAEQHLRVHLHIVQPRCYVPGGPVRTWSTTAANLRGYWNRLRAAADEALATDRQPRLQVSQQCRYCPGRRACPALKRAAGHWQDVATAWQPVHLEGDALGLELAFLERAIAQLEYRAAGLREQAEHALRSGQHVPGWGLEASRSRTEWAVDLDEVTALGDVLGVDLRKPAAVTPKQAAEKLKRAGIDASVIDAYSSSRTGAIKLVPKSETLANKAFGA